MKNFYLKTTVLLLLATIAITSGFRCRWISPSEKQLLEPVELTWWGVSDDQEDFQEIINTYRQQHPNIQITFRTLRLEEYERELVNALAEDRGPDIISLHNTWISKHLSKLEPLPASTKMAYQITQVSLGVKSETVIEVRDERSVTPADVRTLFVDVVGQDVVRENKVYALPLSVDTLVLYYNLDLLNNAGIPLPPTTWQQVQSNVKKLTYQDRTGKLTQGGIALGTSSNVERASDILGLLMMQNGAQMTNGKQVTFGVVPPGFPTQDYNPGPEAVRFYTEFADPTKEVYTWNKDFPNSLDSFAQGQVAMMLGYQYHQPLLEARRQGKLRYGIAPVPQIENQESVNYANYWVYGVSKKSKYINEAWNFLQYLTTKPENAAQYLNTTLHPTALRSLVQEQVNNPDLKVFASQVLTAKSWYQGNSPEGVESAFMNLIEQVHGGTPLRNAMDIAVQKVQQTY